MKLKHIEVFNAIMVSGTVSGAARLLNVTQPAITQTLKHAELHLGFPLFSRVRNRLVPTREGLALHPEIERLFSQLEAVQSLARNLNKDTKTAINILIVPSLTTLLLPMALTYFRKKYPTVPINVRTLHSRDIATAIALREADVGIVYESLPHPALIEMPVALGSLVCVQPVDSPRKKSNGVVHLQTFQNQPLIRIYEKDPIGVLLTNLCGRLGITFKDGITVQTHHTALCLAEYGFGPAIIDVFTAASHQSGSLQIARLEPEVPIRITALRSSESAEVTISNFFIECARKASEEILKRIASLTAPR